MLQSDYQLNPRFKVGQPNLKLVDRLPSGSCASAYTMDACDQLRSWNSKWVMPVPAYVFNCVARTREL